MPEVVGVVQRADRRSSAWRGPASLGVWRSIRRGGVTWVMVSDDAELYRKHCEELTRFATALVGPSAAEDLVSSAVTRSIGGRRWTEVENKRAYLYRAMLNEASRSRRDVQRRLSRESRAAAVEANTEQAADPDVLAALIALSVRQRAVMFLTYWGDLSPPEVASLLSTSPRTVERELAAGKRRLKELLS